MLFIIYKPVSPWFLFHVEKWLFFPEEWVSFAVKWANSTWKKWPKWKQDPLIAIISCYTCLKHCHFCSKQNETDIIIHIRKKKTKPYGKCMKNVSYHTRSVSYRARNSYRSNSIAWEACLKYTLGVVMRFSVCISKIHDFSV